MPDGVGSPQVVMFAEDDHGAMYRRVNSATFKKAELFPVLYKCLLLRHTKREKNY
jgi:hypothetical protein